MVYLIFNKGLRGETEHRPSQDSLHVEFNYRRTLIKVNPNGLFEPLLNFLSNVLISLTKPVLASVLILAILVFVSQQQPTGELEFLLPGLWAFLSLQNWQKKCFVKTVRPGTEQGLQRKYLPVMRGKESS